MTIYHGRVIKNAFVTGIILSAVGAVEATAQSDQWKNPFDDTSISSSAAADSLTLPNVLRLVADANLSLKASKERITAAEHLIKQAGLSPNPELQIELEEVSGNAAGFSESEVNLTLSQELELWGKRSARKRLASLGTEAVRLEETFANFDLYTSVAEQFSRVAHAQNGVALSREEVEIAESIAETAKSRVDKGASLQSEQILGRLQLERARLSIDRAESELINAKIQLSSYWNESRSDYSISQPRTISEILSRVKNLDSYIESSRDANLLNIEERMIEAQLDLEESNAKPNLTLTGGVKRFEVDKTNTFIVGVALPLPLFNRNQGAVSSLRANIEALKLERQQAITDTKTVLKTTERELSQLSERYNSLSASLLPKAEDAYNSLKKAYDSGRIPYSMLLESQRTLIDLRFELNDLMLTINLQLIILDRELGVQFH